MLQFYAHSNRVEAIGSKHKQTVVWWVAEVWARSNNTSGYIAGSKVRWTLGRVAAQVLKSTILSSTRARLTSPHSPAPSSDRASGWSEVPRPQPLLQPMGSAPLDKFRTVWYTRINHGHFVSGGCLSVVTEGDWTELCIMDLYW